MNLLISRHDKIGDFILTLPMIKLAKERIVGATVVVLVSKVNAELSKNLDFIDEVIVYEDDVFSLAKKIKEAKIDVSISAFTDTKVALALFLAGVKKRIAPATKFAQIFSNIRVKQRRSRVEKREFEYNLELLKAVDERVDLTFERPLLKFNEDEKREIFEKFKDEIGLKGEAKIVAFHAGSGGSSDGNLSVNEYVNLAKSIVHVHRVKVVFIFGPDDETVFEEVKKLVDFEAYFFNSKLSLLDFCKLLTNFELFVSTSTGTMHLAGAVNIKTLSFFGNTLFASSNRWGSINEEHKQHNFMIEHSKEQYELIDKTLCEIIGE